MLSALTDDEREVVRRALVAAADGPFIDDDDELEAIFGVDRSALRRTLSEFPRLNAANEVHFLSVNNSLLWIVAYPHKLDAKLADYGLNKETIVAVHRKLREGLGKPANEFKDFIE